MKIVKNSDLYKFYTSIEALLFLQKYSLFVSFCFEKNSLFYGVAAPAE